MCGITGFYSAGEPLSRERQLEIATRMTQCLAHRGPDGSGAWADDKAGADDVRKDKIVFGHTRLAIVDLSPTGAQPMLSSDERFVLTFNGEIYNFPELRNELYTLGHTFRGTSDTEMILAAVLEWGLEESLKRFVGMFAIALWDREEKTLSLSRDRMGEKPLYWGWQGKTFLFGSELKALRTHPDWQGEIDRDAVGLFLRHNYIPAPYSIYKGIRKLLPGTTVTLTTQDFEAQRFPTPTAYWSLKAVAEAGIQNPFSGSDAEAIASLDTLLRDAVGKQMTADVPLGAFLSGGIDSSLIVAQMQAQSSRPVKTFTIGFEDAQLNEAEYAKQVAKHLGTEHHELYVTEKETRAVVPFLPTLYDEPFSDSSQIPTYLVSQMARHHVTVSLSGDGGDELFYGYESYGRAQSVWKKLGLLPAPVRRGLGGAMAGLPESAMQKGLGWTEAHLKSFSKTGNIAEKVHNLGLALKQGEKERFFRHFGSHWKEPERLIAGITDLPTAFSDRDEWADLPSLAHTMMYLDGRHYLPDDILVKVDRASMGVSLECRAPLLDHRVVEFAWRLPLSLKERDGKTKWILREVLDLYVPRTLIERPKMGFAVPLGKWLTGPLREWAETLLDEGRLREEGFFNPAPIRKKWQEHLLNRYNWQYYLWDILMFQSWLEAQRDSPVLSVPKTVGRLQV